ncbi:MAG: hypothetical protein KA795_14890 [Burkholderiaceae bacterium]|nr:hypothetical protein [Burkholderiaceae bacterium]
MKTLLICAAFVAGLQAVDAFADVPHPPAHAAVSPAPAHGLTSLLRPLG